MTRVVVWLVALLLTTGGVWGWLVMRSVLVVWAWPWLVLAAILPAFALFYLHRGSWFQETRSTPQGPSFGGSPPRPPEDGVDVAPLA